MTAREEELVRKLNRELCAIEKTVKRMNSKILPMIWRIEIHNDGKADIETSLDPAQVYREISDQDSGNNNYWRQMWR